MEGASASPAIQRSFVDSGYLRIRRGTTDIYGTVLWAYSRQQEGGIYYLAKENGELIPIKISNGEAKADRGQALEIAIEGTIRDIPVSSKLMTADLVNLVADPKVWFISGERITKSAHKLWYIACDEQMRRNVAYVKERFVDHGKLGIKSGEGY